MTVVDNNPNEYDDDKWVAASSKLMSAIYSMWGAGASLGDIEDTIANALADCDVPAGTLLTIQVG